VVSSTISAYISKRFEVSQSSRKDEHDVDKKTSTPQGKDNIDKATRTVIDAQWMNQTTSD
jgi:hypothetical protein